MSVVEKIKQEYGNLTVSQKKVADYVFRNAEQAAMQTSTEICRCTGVGGSTVIRLAYALGYSGFLEMQRQLREDVLSNMSAPAPESFSNRMEGIIAEEIGILEDMKNGSIDHDQVRRLAARLWDADRIMILGYYAEHTASFQLYLMLDSIRPGVFYFRQNNAGYREAMQLTEKSVIIASSVKPYSPGTLRLVREMKAYGSHIAAFSDSPFCELSMEADETFIIRPGTELLPDCNRLTSLMLLFTVIYNEMIDLEPERALAYFKSVPSQLIQPSINRFFVKDLGPIASDG